MRNILIAVLLTAILSSCTLIDFTDFSFDEINFRNDSVTFYSKSKKAVKTFLITSEKQKLAAITEWVYSNIEYDNERVNYFKEHTNEYKVQTAKTTLERRKGFCADRAILIINIAEYQLGIQMDYISFLDNGLEAPWYQHDASNHGAAYYNDIVYDPGRDVKELNDFCKINKMKLVKITSHDNINLKIKF